MASDLERGKHGDVCCDLHAKLTEHVQKRPRALKTKKLKSSTFLSMALITSGPKLMEDSGLVGKFYSTQVLIRFSITVVSGHLPVVHEWT